MKKLAAIFLVVLLAACGGWHGSGTVIEKDYTAPWVQFNTQCYPSGKTTVCVPNNIHHQARWELKVRDSAGDTHWVDVPESEYARTDIGSSFSNGEER